ncbi:hypothetical protein OQA88_11605 [Cercophora sp. LCS_1]
MLLKTEPNMPRSQLEEILTNDQDNGIDSQLTAAKALVVAVQIMLGLNLNVEGAPGRRLLFTWEESESLSQAIHGVFFIEEDEQDNAVPTPIQQDKFRAMYLHSYADVKPVWTKNLSEHLQLNTEKPKTLKVFKHASLLEAAYATMKDKPEMELSQRLEHGCYDPKFLIETAMTYKLLFPINQMGRKWLDRMIDLSSRGRESRDIPEAKRLAWPATLQLPPGANQRKFERPIESTAELFKRYPHWAVRLQLLFEEADNPTPVSWWEMWAERRKSPRDSFWITFVAFTVAILFGVVSIWIAYCDWRKGSGLKGRQ